MFPYDRCICRFIFFFQAEDGIRDIGVTGVQTCALPISDVGRQGGSVALIYWVADGLTDQVVADGEAFEAVTLKYLPLAPYVAVVFESLVHLEVVAPAGEFQAVVAHLLGEGCEFLQGEVRPLAGKQGYGSRHSSSCLYIHQLSSLLGPGSHEDTAARSRTPIKARENSGMSGQPVHETMLPSTTSGASSKMAPAASRSGFSGGKPETVRPRRRPRAAGTCTPWHTRPTGRFCSKKWAQMRATSGSLRMYSGARPLGITSAAYPSGSASEKARSTGRCRPGRSV